MLAAEGRSVTITPERRRGALGRGNPKPSGMVPSGMAPILDHAVGEPVAYVQVPRTKGRRDRLGSVFQLPDSKGLGGNLARALAGDASGSASVMGGNQQPTPPQGGGSKPKVSRRESLGFAAVLAGFLVVSYLIPQGPLGWLAGQAAPSSKAEVCAGILRSPLCYLLGRNVEEPPAGRVWIIADFSLSSGRATAMSFKDENPQPVLLAQCQRALPNIEGILVERIRQAFADAKIENVRFKCIESQADPLKPQS